MTSLWQQHNIENRVIQILGEVGDDGHHFGRPFLTAYQLAIEFDRRNHDIVTQLDLEVGGAGTGEYVSLAQYLARQLSGYIKNDPDYPIEGAFISNQFVKELSYKHGDVEVTSSLTGTGYSLSMFRLRE
ncbi:unnamed protein product [marine sediment metagenome]|uniref:Uncharacterized protein n=1 Tax=marine sediment metagenome TaxID=412755 RepID=X1TH01_9ZZZZ